MERHEVSEGMIYKLKEGTKLYQEEIFNRRPVIVTKKRDKCAKVASLDMLAPENDYEYRIAIYYFDTEKGKLMSTVCCDMAREIEYEYIEKEIGYIDEETLQKINKKISEKEKSTYQEHIISFAIQNKETLEFLNENMESVKNMMNLLKEKNMTIEEVLDFAQENNYMIKESRKPINIWKERGIGILIGLGTGFISGILVHAATQNNTPQSFGKAMEFSFDIMKLLIESLFYN